MRYLLEFKDDSGEWDSLDRRLSDRFQALRIAKELSREPAIYGSVRVVDLQDRKKVLGTFANGKNA